MTYHIDTAISAIRKQIAEFRKRNNIAKSTFGVMAVNDAHAIDDIDNMTPQRLRKIEKFMKENGKEKLK